MTATEIPIVAPQEKPKARESISEEEQIELAKLERIIAKGELAALNLAEALRVIRDKRLYRAQYDTFDEYCRKRWKLVRRTADMMIATFQARTEIEKNFSQMETTKTLLADTSEHTIRELAKVEPANRIKVFQQAAWQSNGAPPTAKAIARAEAELGLTGETTRPVKPKKNPKRNGHAKPAKKRAVKPNSPKDTSTKTEACLSAYDEWQDASAARWQRDFGARAWRAYNSQVFAILREVRGWWESRIKSEAGI